MLTYSRRHWSRRFRTTTSNSKRNLISFYIHIDSNRSNSFNSTTDSREFKAFIARLPRQKEIDVRQKEDGSIFAFIHCSYCKKHLQAFVDSRWNVWRVYNFVKHTQKHYRVENIRTAKRKRAQGGGETVIDESDDIHS